MEQLLVHVFGDYFCQSSWMAINKSKKSLNCLIHVLIYTACFLILTTSWKALLVIGVTHFLLDRFHTPLKRFIWCREHLNSTLSAPPYKYCDTTGYYDDSPYNTRKSTQDDYVTGAMYGKPRHFFITIWLYIIHDNWIHLFINYMALKYLS